MSDPITQRAELDKQLTGAWDQYTKSAAARQRATVELGQAKRALDAMNKRRPAGRATDKEVARAEQRVAKAEAELQRHSEREGHALDAAKALDADLYDLLRSYPEEYANQAEAVTQQARGALQALQDALRDAREAWERAEQAWAPFCRAHILEGVPPCPLPTPESVLDALPRPQAVKVGQH